MQTAIIPASSRQIDVGRQIVMGTNLRKISNEEKSFRQRFSKLYV